MKERFNPTNMSLSHKLIMIKAAYVFFALLLVASLVSRIFITDSHASVAELNKIQNEYRVLEYKYNTLKGEYENMKNQYDTLANDYKLVLDQLQELSPTQKQNNHLFYHLYLKLINNTKENNHPTEQGKGEQNPATEKDDVTYEDMVPYPTIPGHIDVDLPHPSRPGGHIDVDLPHPGDAGQ